jgi:hypothetical protein
MHTPLPASSLAPVSSKSNKVVSVVLLDKGIVQTVARLTPVYAEDLRCVEPLRFKNNAALRCLQSSQAELMVWCALRAERKREDELKKRTLLKLALDGFPKLPSTRPEPRTPDKARSRISYLRYLSGLPIEHDSCKSAIA